LKKIDKNKKIIVAIDEVQEIQEWELFVNGYLTQYQNKIEIFIT
jgi:predicted AAA+ superfamily ATPase